MIKILTNGMTNVIDDGTCTFVWFEHELNCISTQTTTYLFCTDTLGFNRVIFSKL